MLRPVPSPPENPQTRDAGLVARANAGDVAAFEELYGCYRDWVFALAMRVCGHAPDAEDVLQETFSYLLSKLPGLTLAGRMTTFLYPVVKLLAVRARQRRGRHGGDAEALDGLSTTDPAGEDRGELATVLSGLPEKQREVLLMRTADDMSLEEISAALEIPVGTVKSRLHHALAWLREDPRTRGYFDR